MKLLILLLTLSCSTHSPDGENMGEKVLEAVTAKESKLKSIMGILRKSSGKDKTRPVRGAFLILKDHNNKKLGETKTNHDGSFQFSLDIENGPYSVYYETGDYHKLFNLRDDEKNLGEILLD